MIRIIGQESGMKVDDEDVVDPVNVDAMVSMTPIISRSMELTLTSILVDGP